MEYYRRLVKLQPDLPLNQRNLAIGLHYSKKSQQAALVSSELVKLAPDDASYRQLEIALLSKAGKIAEAEAALAEFMQFPGLGDLTVEQVKAFKINR